VVMAILTSAKILGSNPSAPTFLDIRLQISVALHGSKTVATRVSEGE